MACDPRFALGFIGSSGEGGLKLYRHNFGEKVENVASSGEYHWMAGNFLKYAGPLTPADLPVDAHELIALCAPRPVFVSCGSPQVEGNWVDSRGQFSRCRRRAGLLPAGQARFGGHRDAAARNRAR